MIIPNYLIFGRDYNTPPVLPIVLTGGEMSFTILQNTFLTGNNVLAGDTINGEPATQSNVDVSLVGAPSYLSVDTSGNLIVDVGMIPGGIASDGINITITYEVCQKNTDNCQTAEIDFTIYTGLIYKAPVTYSPSFACESNDVEVVITGQGFLDIEDVYLWIGGVQTPLPFTEIDFFNIKVLIPAGTPPGDYNIYIQTPYFVEGGYIQVPVPQITVLPTFVVNPITPSGTQTLCTGNQLLFESTTPTGLWESSDESVLTIDANGLATAVGSGNVTIYYVVNNGFCTVVVSEDAVVRQPASVVNQPINTSVIEGEPAQFNVLYTGDIVSVKWEVSTDNGFSFTPINDGGVYSGTDTDTLVISDTTGLDGLYYRLAIDAESPCSDVESFAALVQAKDVGISQQPQNQTICYTETTADFSVVAYGDVQSYQWYVDYGFGPFPITDPVDLFYPEISYSDFDTATLTVNGLTTDHNGLVFSVDVNSTTNTAFSNQAVLTVQTDC